AGLVLPLFNLPLVFKIYRTKSAKDFSLIWGFGIWICLLLMLPQVMLTPDLSFRVFGLANFSFFTLVLVAVLRYRF
ncbi:MAG: hypothetical protein U1D33_00420, partial [bacterium]|nr:hypothetical protein [bacterium]